VSAAPDLAGPALAPPAHAFRLRIPAQDVHPVHGKNLAGLSALNVLRARRREIESVNGPGVACFACLVGTTCCWRGSPERSGRAEWDWRLRAEVHAILESHRLARKISEAA